MPCLARWPGVIPAGRTCGEFLTALEVFPTLAKAAGAPDPAGVTLDGFDMLPVLRGASPSPRAEMFWQRRDDRAARLGRYKWVESSRGSGLYDLEKDVGEKNDLGKERPEVLVKVQARWREWRKAMDEAEPRGPFRDY